MKKAPLFIASMLLLAATLACYAPSFSGGVAPAVEPPGVPGGGDVELPTYTPIIEILPIFTPTITPSPTITLTPTSSSPMVQAGPQDVNCRYGPSTDYLPTGYLLKGFVTPILGKSEDGYWWYIQDPRNAGIYCFVSQSVTVSSGDLSSLHTISTPATRVTRVTVQVDVPAPTPCVGGWPISVGFTATIETNGPGVVTWRWELSQGNISATSTLNFDSFGAKPVSDNYHIGAAGNYWVRMHVLTPNDKTGQGDYEVTCTP